MPCRLIDAHRRHWLFRWCCRLRHIIERYCYRRCFYYWHARRCWWFAIWRATLPMLTLLLLLCCQLSERYYAIIIIEAWGAMLLARALLYITLIIIMLTLMMRESVIKSDYYWLLRYCWCWYWYKMSVYIAHDITRASARSYCCHTRALLLLCWLLLMPLLLMRAICYMPYIMLMRVIFALLRERDKICCRCQR